MVRGNAKSTPVLLFARGEFVRVKYFSEYYVRMNTTPKLVNYKWCITENFIRNVLDFRDMLYQFMARRQLSSLAHCTVAIE